MGSGGGVWKFPTDKRNMLRSPEWFIPTEAEQLVHQEPWLNAGCIQQALTTYPKGEHGVASTGEQRLWLPRLMS